MIPGISAWAQVAAWQAEQKAAESAREKSAHCWNCGRFMKRVQGMHIFMCSRCDVTYWPEKGNLGYAKYDPQVHIDHGSEHVPVPA